MKMRLNKLISTFGSYPRRKADELILNGKVFVDGQSCLRPFQEISTKTSQVMVEGRLLDIKPSSKVFAVNKPVGFLCSHKRLKPSQSLIYDLFGKNPQRLFTAGRLDQDSQGLIIVTNDGDLAFKLTHPSHQIEKEYLVKTSRPIKTEDIKKMLDGVVIDKVLVKPKKIVKLRSRTVRFVLTEGKKHEVRLLCNKAGLEVMQLKRVRIGSLSLGKLAIGQVKQLSSREIAALIE